jgi:hypothetical protein
MTDASTAPVHVIVTCSSRKRIPAPPQTQMRRVTAKTLTRRMESWVERLVNAPVPPLGADELYCGGHWDVVRRLRTTSKVPVTTWVVSAGYGLIPVSAPVTPYAATFTNRHPDSVTSSGSDASSWWELLAEWDGPVPGAPRSISKLVASQPDARFLLVLSEPYLRACLPDVRRGIARSGTGNGLSIVCGGARSQDQIGPWLVPCNARLQSVLGGAMQSLNVRLAAHLLKTGAIGHKAMVQRAGRLLAEQPARQRHTRQPLTDAQVRRFIASYRRDDPQLTATRALRALRDAGFACEQGRFGNIFNSLSAGAT